MRHVMDQAGWIVLGALTAAALVTMWTGLRVASVEPPTPGRVSCGDPVGETDQVCVPLVDDVAIFAAMKSARQVRG